VEREVSRASLSKLDEYQDNLAAASRFEMFGFDMYNKGNLFCTPRKTKNVNTPGTAASVPDIC
jgi:hypothetical protein